MNDSSASAPFVLFRSATSRDRQLGDSGVEQPRWANTSLILTRLDGSPILTRTLHYHFTQLVKRIGLPHIRCHDLRHTAATLMLAQGIHPKIVQERLGHASISMTLDRYSHVSPMIQQEAANYLDQTLAETSCDLRGDLGRFRRAGEGPVTRRLVGLGQVCQELLVTGCLAQAAQQ
jgi:hypothetical protein